MIKMKCEICKTTIETTFLKKMLGTVVKDKKGKKHNICAKCQKDLGNKEEILKKL